MSPAATRVAIRLIAAPAAPASRYPGRTDTAGACGRMPRACAEVQAVASAPESASGDNLPTECTLPPMENLPGLGRVSVLEMPFLKSEATPSPLVAGVPVLIELPAPGLQRVTEVQAFIATYGTRPSGDIRIEACARAECFPTIESMAGAADNTFLRLPLPEAAAGSSIDSLRITLLDARDSVAIWSFEAAPGSAVFSDGPRQGSAAMLRIVQKFD